MREEYDFSQAKRSPYMLHVAGSGTAQSRTDSMAANYPAIFTKLEDGYMVYVPDLECNTQGDDMAEAFAMGRDVVGMMCMDMEDDGKQLPTASDPATLKVRAGEFVSMLDVDVDAYRRAHSQR